MAATSREGNKIYPAKNGFYRKIYNENWGVYLNPCDNPDSILSEEDIKGIRIHDDFDKITKEYWSAWISLCFYMCPKGGGLTDSRFHDKQLEVGAAFLRKADDKTQWKIIVPQQRVSGISVKADMTKSIDIVTGERFTQFPPPGWKHAGSTHSHNKMGAFYSSTDNESELGCSGLHIVVGKIDHNEHRYAHVASVTVQKMRKHCKLREVVDVTSMRQPFHPDVLKYINEVVATYTQTTSGWWGSKKSKSEFTLKPRKKFTFPDLSKDPDFLRGLDRNNSDLFDEDNRYIGWDEDLLSDIMDLVSDLVAAGQYTVDDVLKAIDENREVLEEDDDDDNVIMRLINNNDDDDNDDFDDDGLDSMTSDMIHDDTFDMGW